MSDVDDQDLTIKVLRERCAELKHALQVVAHERDLFARELENVQTICKQLRADIAAIYDAQNG